MQTLHALKNVPLRGDGKRPIERLTRGDGFELISYDWSEETGEAKFTYERPNPLATPEERAAGVGVIQAGYVEERPAGRRHAGWRWHNGRYT